MTAIADPDALSVTVEATAPNAQLASAKATAFANGVMQFLSNSQQQLNETKKAELQAELDSVNTRVSELQAQIAGANEGLVPILTARRDAEVARYGQLYGQLQQLNNTPAESGLETLGSPSLGDHSGGGLPVPVRPVPRALVFGAVGLLLGAIAAVIVSRLDTRLRRRPDIEAAFDAPVIAEIPRVSSPSSDSAVAKSSSTAVVTPLTRRLTGHCGSPSFDRADGVGPAARGRHASS